MRAVVCERYGPPEVLRIQELELPHPIKSEVRIRVSATAVNSSDCIIRGMQVPMPFQLLARVVLGVRRPRRPVLGMVLAGCIDKAGSPVRLFKEGDRVFGLDRWRFGTYAEQVCWPERTTLSRSPRNLTDQEAAALPFGGLLALHYLRRARILAGQRILIYGASGAIGTAAVQLAKHFGAYVTGVCSAANVGLVRSLGADDVIDYTVEDFTERDASYDVILDAVGKRKSAVALRHSARSLARGGRRLSVSNGSPGMTVQDLIFLTELAESGRLRPVIDRRYPLADIVEAHRYVEAGHKRGNVIISVASAT